jgi:hypothetical protein
MLAIILYIIELALNQFQKYIVLYPLFSIIVIIAYFNYRFEGLQTRTLEHLILTGVFSFAAFFVLYYIFNERIVSYLFLLAGLFMPFSLISTNLLQPSTQNHADSPLEKLENSLRRSTNLQPIHKIDTALEFIFH